MTKDEALRLALEALERIIATCLDPYSHEQVRSRPEHFINQATTAIKAALEAKDEPVAIFKADLDCGYVDLLSFQGQPLSDNTLLYTTPPQRKPLTYEELESLVKWHGEKDNLYFNRHEYARAIEAAHGIKEEA
jgi:hypothetical protein